MLDSSPASSTVYARPLDSCAIRLQRLGIGRDRQRRGVRVRVRDRRARVPRATVKIGTFARPAWRATCERVAAGRRLAVGEQHDRRGRAAAVLAVAREPSSAAASASPVAVEPSAIRPLTIRAHVVAARRRRLDGVGRVGVRDGADAHRAGHLDRNRSAAERAASRRVGETSVAIIEREWSVTSTTEACSAGTATVRFGLASARTSAAIASSASTAGQVAPPDRASCRARRAQRRRRRCSARRTSARAGGTCAAEHRERDQREPEQRDGGLEGDREGGKRHRSVRPSSKQPVAVGRQDRVIDAQAAQFPRDLLAVARARRRRSARAARGGWSRPRRARRSRGRRARGARPRAASASRGSRTSTARTEWRMRSAPIARVQSCWPRKSEIDDDEAGLQRDAPDAPEGVRQRVRLALAVGRDALGERPAQRRSSAGRLPRGGISRMRAASRTSAARCARRGGRRGGR